MACGVITASQLVANCTDIQPAGLKAQDIYILNLEDISAKTTNVGTGAIEGYTMVATKTAFKYSGFDNSTSAGARGVTGRGFGPQFEHEVSGVMFASDNAAKDEAANLQIGKYVVIVETNNENAPFQEYGGGVGMKATEVEQLLNDAGSGSGIRFLLKTDDADNAPPEKNLSKDVFITDRAATKAMLEALL